MKTYISRGRNLTIFLTENGVQNMIRFRDMGPVKNCGIYSTNDPELIRQLESDHRFNDQYYLQDDSIEEEVKEEVHVYAAEYPDVKRTQEAKKILVNEYGVNGDLINTKADALEYANSLNINFPKLT